MKRSCAGTELPAVSRNSSPTSSQREHFLVEYNPSMQLRIGGNAEECLWGDYPTLAEVSETYGSKTLTAWLLVQLYDLSEYCGCKEKLEGAPMEQCAAIIAAEYGWMKVSEIMLFLYRFKAGVYGHFYGSVDALRIMVHLRDFVAERREMVWQLLKKSEMKEDGGEYISWQEWQRRKGQYDNKG